MATDISCIRYFVLILLGIDFVIQAFFQGKSGGWRFSTSECLDEIDVCLMISIFGEVCFLPGHSARASTWREMVIVYTAVRSKAVTTFFS
jgi:hypothetical protein